VGIFLSKIVKNADFTRQQFGISLDFIWRKKSKTAGDHPDFFNKPEGVPTLKT
jgi:hypothetical protein